MERLFSFDVVWKKVKVTQSCSTLCDPMGCRSPGSSVHGILQARILEWVAIPFLPQRIFPTQGSNPGLLNCGQILCCLSLCGLDSYLRYTPVLVCPGLSGLTRKISWPRKLLSPQNTYLHWWVVSVVLMKTERNKGYGYTVIRGVEGEDEEVSQSCHRGPLAC